jgi:hypothetical protein
MSTYKPTFVQLVKDFMEGVKQTEIKVLIPFMSAFIVTILSMGLSIYYVYTMVMTLLERLSLKVPLNEDTLEFDAIPSTSFFTFSDYNMWLFFIFPLIVFASLLVIPVLTSNNFIIPDIIKILIWVLLFHNIMVFIVFAIFFFESRYKNSLVNKRLSIVDNYICSKIYRNANVLKILREPRTDFISIINTIQEVMRLIPQNIKEDDLAKVFYTLHLYFHYHKIGVRNPRIQQALNTFSISSLLLRQCKPTKYFNRFGTYIEDINETIKEYLPQNFSKTDIRVKNALNKCYVMVMQTNNMANSIYPEDALRPFLSLNFANLTIQTVSLLILSYFVAEGDKFRSLVNNITSAVQVATIGVAV